MTRRRLITRSALKLTGCPAPGLVGENVNAGVKPLWPVVTMPPVPIDWPPGPNTARPVEYDPASGNVWTIDGVVVSWVGAANASLNCQLKSATPPGAVEPVASNVIVVPPSEVTV